MKTKHKILFAKIIFFFISKFKKKNIKIIRNNILWDLDLSEGIDLSIYIFGKFEFEIIKAIAKHKLSQKPVFLDIGANIGVQTLQLCNYFKDSTIYSFEPTKYAYNKLCNNIFLNPKLKKKIILNQAFLTSKKNIIPKKIYVDGHELDVLKSGYKFLKKNKTPIIFEVAPYLYKEHNYLQSDLVNLFKKLGYSFYNIHNLKKLKNVNKYISSILDGESATLIAK